MGVFSFEILIIHFHSVFIKTSDKTQMKLQE